MDGVAGVDLYPSPPSPSCEHARHASFEFVLDEVRSKADPNIVPVNTPPAPLPPDQTTPDGHIMGGKIQRQLTARGWTPEAIDRAVRHGSRIDAINKETGGPATRYVDPKTGQSVVIDNTTNRVIQVLKPGDKSDARSGDMSGAKMRPAPESPTNETSPPGGGAGVVPAPVEPTVPEIPEIPPI